MIYYNDLLGAKYKPHGRGDGGYDCYGLVLECCRRAGTPIKDSNGKTEFARFLDWNETTNGSGSVPITLTYLEKKSGTKEYFVIVGNWKGQRFKEISLTLEEC